MSDQLNGHQKLVLGALNGASGPQSAYALLDQLRDKGLRAPLQVYRALDKLQQAGLVHRLESLNAFIACSHCDDCQEHGHHHGMVAFAICEMCGKVEEFSDDEVEARLAGWAARSGFQPAKTSIELRGRCSSCLTT